MSTHKVAGCASNRHSDGANWTSACAYSARLAATGDNTLSSAGASILRTVMAVFEAVETDKASEVSDNAEAAAQVFKYAARELLHACKKNRKDGVWEQRDGTWQGGEGLSKKRWDYWRERWTMLSHSDEQSPEVQKIARDVVSIMERVEG
jgi:hypothetical protein